MTHIFFRSQHSSRSADFKFHDIPSSLNSKPLTKRITAACCYSIC